MNWLRNMTDLLGINSRNIEYVYEHNQREDFPLVDNKILTKTFLSEHGFPGVPQLLDIQHYFDLQEKWSQLQSLSEIVIKPAKGFGGNGILVLGKRTNNGWLTASGNQIQDDEVQMHLNEILFGVYSMTGDTDTVLVEHRLLVHPALAPFSYNALADIRIINFQETNVMAMLRLPTKESGGKANLHQGGIGVGIDLTTGKGTGATYKGSYITHHPETGLAFTEIALPFWDQICELTEKTAQALPLNYLGFDWVVTNEGAYILELNARPGLEIQNANQTRLKPQLIEALK